jgi:hypothetical protein
MFQHQTPYIKIQSTWPILVNVLLPQQKKNQYQLKEKNEHV